MVSRLLGIQVLSVLDTKAQKVAQLSSRINFSLEGILSLAVHGQGHDIVPVLGRDEISGFEERLARSAKGVEAHDSRADRAASIADWTWGAVALEYEARGACEEGLDWVRVAFLSS